MLVCVSDTAPPAIKQAAADLVAHAANIPLLAALQAGQGAGDVTLTSSETLSLPKNYNLAAHNHIIAIGLRSEDPVVARVWDHYATVDETAKSLYMQGWGHLQGDIGYIESDRNPYLHSRKIQTALYETIVVKISGTSVAGVVAAEKAFEGGALNALVPAGPVARPETTLLDLDPFVDPPPFTMPGSAEVTTDSGKALQAPLVGWTQVPGNEYRAYIDVAGFEPVHVWRYKYLQPGLFNSAGIPAWLGGLHRMAYGNAVTIAEFSTPDQARKTLAAYGQTGGAGREKLGTIPALRVAEPTDEQIQVSNGYIHAFVIGKYFVMSSLSPAGSAAVVAVMGQ